MTAPSRVLIGTDLIPADPDCSIDYARLGGLPVGVAPASLAPDEVGAWIATMAATAGVRVLARPAEDDLDPLRPAELRVAQVTSRNGALSGVSTVLVRRDLAVGSPARIALTAAQVDAVGRRGPVPADDAGRATWYAARITTFAWDDAARAASAAPMPCPVDEAVVVHWGPDAGTAAIPTLPVSQAGALDDDDARYALTTDATLRGELEPLLMRAPHPGLVRFERYRHLGVDSGGGLGVIRSSGAGRVLLHSSPLAAVAGVRAIDDGSRSPWKPGIQLAFDNLDAASVPGCLAAILWDHVTHLESRLDEPRIKQDRALRSALEQIAGTLLQTWRAWLVLRVDAGGVSADITSMAADAEALVPLDKVPLGGAALAAATAAVLGDTQLRSSLRSYAIGMFAPLLCGDEAVDLLVSRDAVVDAGFASAHAAEQGVLIALIGGVVPWLPVYAGAPLGKPAAVYAADGVLPTGAAAAVAGGLLTHDCEALHLAGATSALSSPPAVASAAAIAAAEPLNLAGFDHLEVGRACVIRLSGSAPAFTTRDWLAEMARGTVRTRYQPPMFEPWRHAHAGHPLLVADRWDRAGMAWGLREQLNTLADARVPSGSSTVSLGAAAASWWAGALVLSDASGEWPWLDFTSTTWLKFDDPTPQNPFQRSSGVSLSALFPGGVPVVPVRHPSATRRFPSVQGFDDLDLEVAIEVTELVRSGADLSQPIELALVLALMERENYRLTSARRRGVESEIWDMSAAHSCFKPSGAAASGVPAKYQGRSAIGTYLARRVWCAQHYGADRLTIPVPASPVGFGDKTFAQSNGECFDAMLAELTATDASGNRLLSPTFVASGDVARFIDERLAMVFGGGSSMVADFTVRSPRLQLVGVALQAALLQWFHRKLVTTTGASDDYRAVAEFTAAAPPPIGAHANALERRDYLAYHAATYLAYNTASGPGSWNAWMAWADARRGSEAATRFLLFHGDPTGQSDNRQGQLGHMARFALALDGYARLDTEGARGPDGVPPDARTGAW